VVAHLVSNPIDQSNQTGDQRRNHQTVARQPKPPQREAE
jgi:hypothetical protein